MGIDLARPLCFSAIDELEYTESRLGSELPEETPFLAKGSVSDRVIKDCLVFFRPSVGFGDWSESTCDRKDDTELSGCLVMYFADPSGPIVVLTGGSGGDCMARDGCFLDLRPIAEAMELKVRPVDFGKACREDLLDEYGLPFVAAFGSLEDRDHHEREEPSERDGKAVAIRGERVVKSGKGIQGKEWIGYRQESYKDGRGVVNMT